MSQCWKSVYSSVQYVVITMSLKENMKKKVVRAGTGHHGVLQIACDLKFNMLLFFHFKRYLKQI